MNPTGNNCNRAYYHEQQAPGPRKSDNAHQQRHTRIPADTSSFATSNGTISERHCTCCASNHAHFADPRKEELYEISNIKKSSFYRSELALAAKHGNIDKVAALVSSGKNANSYTTGIRTPLYAAVTNNNPAVVLYLLEHGANPDAFAHGRNNPIYVAIGPKVNIKIVEALLNHKANIHGNSSGWITPLNRAAYFGHSEIVKKLIALGALKGRENDTGWNNPVTQAARNGHASIVKMLLEAGADPCANLPDGDRLTPYYQACAAWNKEGKQKKHLETITLLENRMLDIT